MDGISSPSPHPPQHMPNLNSPTSQSPCSLPYYYYCCCCCCGFSIAPNNPGTFPAVPPTHSPDPRKTVLPHLLLLLLLLRVGREVGRKDAVLVGRPVGVGEYYVGALERLRGEAEDEYVGGRWVLWWGLWRSIALCWWRRWWWGWGWG